MELRKHPNGIGSAVRRTEDARFLTGRGRYVADADVAGQTHAVFVRSPYPHAAIRGIDSSAARRVPGVLAVYTGEEIRADGVGVLELDLIARDHEGRPMVAPDRRALAVERVRYVGEPVAIVIAESVYSAKDGAEAVEVEYEELPAVIGLEEALAEGAPRLWPEAVNNIAAEVHYGAPAEVSAAFAGAAHRVSLELVNNRVAVNPIEPRAAIARYDRFEDRYRLYVSHQTPFPLRTQLAATLGISEQRLHVVSPDVGGGFGVKGPTYPEEACLLWAARRLGRPIRWVCERCEMFLSDAQARDHVTTIELALDAEGRFLALRVRDLANLGAYLSSYGAGPPLVGQRNLLAGMYRTPHIAGRVHMVFTNTVPTDAYRAPGRAECGYMTERVIDVAARELGLSPVELRRRNLIPAESMPYRSPTGVLYDSGDFPAVFEKALQHADWAGFERRGAQAQQRNRLRGLGIACYIDQTGMGPSRALIDRGMKIPSYESALVRLNKDGGVTVVTGTHSHGQGLETALAQIVVERLGVALTDVEVLHGDTQALGYGRGTVGARSLLSGGAALEAALGKVIEKGRRIAAHALECAAQDLAFEGGHYTIKGTDRKISLGEVARLAYFPGDYPIEELEPGLEETAYWDPKAVAFPNGCHVCEVEIDPDTGVLNIASYACVDDFGNIVNPLLVSGQVHGGVAQGLGQALLEHCLYDSTSGQLLTGSLMDYCLPRADDLPSIIDATMPGQPCTTNPLGVKGCGEVGTIGAPPALVNAVVDALRPFGVRHVDMPVTAEKLWRLMHPDA